MPDPVSVAGGDLPWTAAPLVAFDLEGTGAQDGVEEAILEVAAVPMEAGCPVSSSAFATLINPGRPVPRRPWISPGLTGAPLAEAPTLLDIGPRLAARLDGCWIVGHNVRVDWRLLRRRLPALRPAGLLDTLRLARAVHPPRPGPRRGLSLTALLDRYRLIDAVTAVVPDGQPHRALWDTVAAGRLLAALITDHWPAASPTLNELVTAAAVPLTPDSTPADARSGPDALF